MRRALAVLGLVVSAGHAAACDVDAARLRADLERMRRQLELPAIAFALVDARQVLDADTWGIANAARARPATRDTRFRVGSITKTVTALAALALAREGRLDPDARWDTLVPDLPIANRWAATHPVRLVHLLEHTAGLADLTRGEFDDNAARPLHEALRHYLGERVTQWPPGLHAEYSNAGYGLAGLAIERAAGEPYERVVDTRVLGPLGMSGATFTPAPATLATGYARDRTTVIPYWHMVYPPFGGLAATAADMALLVRALLARGEGPAGAVLPAETVERLERPRTTLAARAGLAYGYGLGNYAWQRAGHTFHGHGGDGDGYLAHYGYSVALDCGYYVAINAFDGDALRDLRGLVEERIVAGHPAPAPPPAAEIAGTGEVAGLYAPATWRFPWAPPGTDDRLEVVATDGRLMTRSGARPPRELVVVSGGFVRRPGETTATAAFVRGDDGALYLQGDMGNWRREP